MVAPNKSLGQHWLNDKAVLASICDAANVADQDIVLEIGPGQGSLTRHLVKRAKQVITIELDGLLAAQLKISVPAKNLQVQQADILKFDLNSLPSGYKVVANIPYYLTGHLLRILTETPNPPAIAVLLVQKEVAQRIAAEAGQMSVISVIVQLLYEVSLGQVVPAKLFTPPPKVDSQAIMLTRRQKPLFDKLDQEAFFRLVKAGFSARRKKLRSSLSGGLQISKEEADALLKKAGISGDLRAQNLTLDDWRKLSVNV